MAMVQNTNNGGGNLGLYLNKEQLSNSLSNISSTINLLINNMTSIYNAINNFYEEANAESKGADIKEVLNLLNQDAINIKNIIILLENLKNSSKAAINSLIGYMGSYSHLSTGELTSIDIELNYINQLINNTQNNIKYLLKNADSNQRYLNHCSKLLNDYYSQIDNLKSKRDLLNKMEAYDQSAKNTVYSAIAGKL